MRTSQRLRQMLPLFTRQAGWKQRHLGLFLLLGGLLLGGGLTLVRLILRLEEAKPVHTIASRLEQFGASVDQRLRPEWEGAGLSYPPSGGRRLLLVAFKAERRLDVYDVAFAPQGGTFKDAPLRALEPGAKRRFIKSYPILGASGGLGPKLREGDLQVPEGFYGIEYLNPNSSFHLSMKIAYPNADDHAQAAKEGRSNLGGDIMIHGNTGSRGCLAMGDPAAEELFILLARLGVENGEVLISPVDFRHPEAASGALSKAGAFPPWVQVLHERLQQAVRQL